MTGSLCSSFAVLKIESMKVLQAFKQKWSNVRQIA